MTDHIGAIIRYYFLTVNICRPFASYRLVGERRSYQTKRHKSAFFILPSIVERYHTVLMFTANVHVLCRASISRLLCECYRLIFNSLYAVFGVVRLKACRRGIEGIIVAA